MSTTLHIHPLNPQQRLIHRAIEIIRQGGVIVYPTDSAYALGCQIGDKHALDRIRQIRQIDEKHNLTLICRDLSDISTYAIVNNSAFRFLKAYTPGPYTFLLKATREVPRRLQNPHRKTIGIRIPENPIAMALLEALGEPMMTTTLILPNEEMPLLDPYEIDIQVGHAVDLIIDGGYCGFEATTVFDLVDDIPTIVRQGKGDVGRMQ
ncbi:MAG: threonylcarbamoyl-AMP synthase [Legionellales bacterium]|nr:threonylcarbamoyl-AMP synthase [Legionellales bacterium]